MTQLKSNPKTKDLSEDQQKLLLSNYYNKINSESARLEKMAEEVKQIFLNKDNKEINVMNKNSTI